MTSPTTENPERTSKPNAARSIQDRLIDLISPLIASMGYEVVYVEIHNQRQKILRLFIDHLNPTPGKGIGIEDCVAVTRALDEPLDQITELEGVFHGAYELEVSSPGVDRPLRNPRDYERFAGREVRIHVYRPLTAQELGNPGYQSKNPKQKNFLGMLKGIKEDQVLLAIPASGSFESQKGKPSKKAQRAAKAKAAPHTNSAEEEVTIPLPLISKANLEPQFDGLEDERE